MSFKIDGNGDIYVDDVLIATLSGTGIRGTKPATHPMDLVTLGQLASSVVPSGTVVASASLTTPTGWLKCNGQVVSRTGYPALFLAIGTQFGAGDGTTTFGLPDLRGEFIRGWDEGRGADAGRAFGSWQQDAIRNIVGSFRAVRRDGGDESGAFYANAVGYSGSDTGGSWMPYSTFDASRVVPTAADNRPRNVALQYFIKA